MTLQPTPEQSAIIDAAACGHNLMVFSYAGTAKTTTLTMISQSVDWPAALCLAFNVKIRDELKRRMPPNWTIMTLNGLGHRAWGKAIGKQLTLDDKKLGKILTAILREHKIEASGDEWANARRLVSSAQAAGLVPSAFPHKGLIPDTDESWQDLCDALWIEPTPALLAVARETLTVNIKMAFAGTVSFDDQIYMSTLFHGVFPRFEHVLVDEAQDLSPLNHIQITRCSSRQVIAVGDPRQAIYAFRGADSNSMTNLRSIRIEWKDLPLTTTFRCPKAIVVRQQTHAPGFNAHESNPYGDIISLQGEPWEYNDHIASRPGPIAMLCRNNAPLLAMAFKLIRRKIGCVMLGRDIGKGLVALSKKIIPNDDTSAADCVLAVQRWQDTETSIALANKKEEKLDGIEDRAECLFAVLNADHINNAKDLRDALTTLFSRSAGMVTLSTIHRAKGLEWPTVVHLDPWRLPSKRAKGAQIQQERNLLYVCETRAQQELVLANVEDFQ